tara:strand:- start:5916 stop:7589 length:1674 start_codon:yes stop_codon:yes gene_type:complete
VQADVPAESPKKTGRKSTLSQSAVLDTEVLTIADADLARSKSTSKMPVKKVTSHVPSSKNEQPTKLNKDPPYSGVAGPGNRKLSSSAKSSDMLSDLKKPRKSKSKPKAQVDGEGWITVPGVEKGRPDLENSPSPRIATISKATGSNTSTPPTLEEFPAMPGSPPERRPTPPACDRLQSGVGSWASMAASSPPAAQESVKLSVEGMHEEDSASQCAEPQKVPTGADFPMTLPHSPPRTPSLPQVSYAKTANSASLRPASKTAIVGADALPQLDLNDSSPHPPAPSFAVEQKLDNLLVMIRQARQNLFKGPRITIFVGRIAIKGIFKRVAMAVSSMLNRHFSRNPESVEYHFGAGYLDPEALRFLLISWVQDTSREFEAYAVPMRGTFAQNVALLRAARVLGMERYTRHILKEFVDYLKTDLPSYEEIAIVEHNATSDQDPLWTGLVNHLCHDRHKKFIPDPEAFEAFLEQHPRLKKAMVAADAYFQGEAKKNRDAKQALWQVREDGRRERWEKNQAEKRARIEKEKQTADSLRKKMEATGGSGLMFATAEEAEFLRSR